MRNLLTLIIVLLSICSQGQNGLNNLDFENWSSGNQNLLGWSLQMKGIVLGSPFTQIITGQNIKDSIDVKHGNYSINLICNDTTVMSMSATYYNFAKIDWELYQETGVPKSIQGYVKYNLQANDTAIIWIGLKKNGQLVYQDLIQFAGIQNNWQFFSKELNNAILPDSISIILSPSKNALGVGNYTIGSVFKCDDFSFTYKQVFAGIDTTIVCGESKQLNAISFLSGVSTYSWSPANGLSSTTISNPIANPISTTTYTVTVNSGSETATDTITITVNPLTVNAGIDKIISCGTSVVLNTTNNFTGTSNLQYYWAPSTALSSTNISNPTASPINPTTYTVTLTSHGGDCIATDAVQVSNSVILENPEICLVTVDTTSMKNIIIWEKPISTAIDSFKIYREIASAYVPISSIPYPSTSFYTDVTNGVNPFTTSYKYKISVVDICRNETILSAYHRTIHVAISPASPCGYNLIWNDYEGFPVTQYLIYRDSSNTGWEKIDSVSFGNTSWTDATCYSLNDTISYLVEAVNPAGCNPTKAGGHNSTRSNVQRNYAISVPKLSVNDFSLKISPNPTNGKFTLTMLNPQLLLFTNQLSITNIQGEVLYQSKITNLKTDIDLTGQTNGIYFVNVKSSEKIYHQKLIKQ